MPTNVTIEYQLAEREYNGAKTPEEKIRAIERMLATAPTHKGAENLRANLKLRLSKYKKQIDIEKKTKSNRHQVSVKKEGEAQIVILGVTNSGKSTLLAKITNAKPLIGDFPYTTKLPEIGIMDYYGVKIQIVEMPSISENFMKSSKGPLFLGIIRQADMAIIILKKDPKYELDLIINELNKSNIKINEKIIGGEYDYAAYLKGIILLNTDIKYTNKQIKTFHIDDPDLKKKIWSSLDIIYVYTKTPGKKKDYPPVALKKNSNVRKLATIIHKDFIKKFQYAKVWGASSKFEKGQVVGLNHILKEKDIVEFHLK